MPAEGQMGRVAYVFAGGDSPRADVLDGLPPPDVVVAADSGLHHALALGVPVDVVVGDFDSADAVAVDAAVVAGAALVAHASAKDATDLELAVDAARDAACDRIVVVGGHGGRLDHFVANLLLLGSERFADVEVEARVGNARVYVVRTRLELTGRPGHLCTLLPIGGAAIGVRTEGLRFPLDHETLEPGSTRGVSNEFRGTDASVSLDRGALLAILPQPEEGISP
jgi:thiamine pyrophosphokinase